MPYADYTYYTETYYGNAITEAEWPRLAARASAFLDYITMGRASRRTELRQVKLACCAIAEDYKTIKAAKSLADASLAASVNSASKGNAELQSQTVGNYSKTFKSGGTSARDALTAAASAQETLLETAKLYLAGTGLLQARGYHA